MSICQRSKTGAIHTAAVVILGMAFSAAAYTVHKISPIIKKSPIAGKNTAPIVPNKGVKIIDSRGETTEEP